MSSIFTIGHSNNKANDFMSLLDKYQIDMVVDVRTNPHSRYRHFNRDRIKIRLESAGIAYLYLGDRLGGHPREDSFYLDSRVIYERLASSPRFRRGIKRVVEAAAKNNVVIMCVEHDPGECHRHPLLASALQDCGMQVLHIQRDGSILDATEMPEETDFQLPLFEPPGEDRTWCSPKPIPGHSHSRDQISGFPSQSTRQSYSGTPTEMAIWLQSKLVSGWRERT